MIRVRLRFSKSDSLSCIGHLDFMRLFQKTIRKSGLPAAFSQGFNPHLLLSFALPLPLGMESVNDYAEVTLNNEVPCGEITERLNSAAPSGLFVKDAYAAEGKAAALVVAADYRFKCDCGQVGEKINNLLRADSVIVPKKTKTGVRDTDIRCDILAVDLDENIVNMRLSAGSSRFIHPLAVAEVLLGEKPSAAAVTRVELFQAGNVGGLTAL